MRHNLDGNTDRKHNRLEKHEQTTHTRREDNGQNATEKATLTNKANEHKANEQSRRQLTLSTTRELKNIGEGKPKLEATSTREKNETHADRNSDLTHNYQTNGPEPDLQRRAITSHGMNS
jgi:hypothetical protein